MSRLLSLTLLLAALSLMPLASGSWQTARAQESSVGEHGIEVVKFGWSKERLGWERDPFSGPLENFDEMRARARNEKRVDEAKRGGGGADVDRARREARADAANVGATRANRPARYAFHYKLAVRNAGAKAVREIDWDYVFLDATTGEELGRQQFTGAEKIAPGKRKELGFLTRTPPTQRISAHALDKREREGIVEKVVVVRVLYEDGTVWQPAASPSSAPPPAP
jgi:hypothetical protein